MPLSSTSLIRNFDLRSGGEPGRLLDRSPAMIFEWFDPTIGSSGGWSRVAKSWYSFTPEMRQALIDNYNLNGRSHFMTEGGNPPNTNNPVPYSPMIETQFGTMTIDQWADDYGGFHPFRADALESVNARHKFAGRVGYHGSVTDEKVTLRNEIESETETKDGGTVDLRAWDVNATSDGAEIVLYDVGVPAAQVPSQAAVVGLIKWLNARKASGDSILTGAANDAGWGAEAGATGHEFSVVEGGSTWRFTFSSVEAPTAGGNVRLLRLNVVFDDSPFDIGSPNRLKTALDRTETIPAGTDVEIDHGLIAKVMTLAGVRADVKRGLARFDGVPLLNHRVGVLSTAGSSIDASRTQWHHTGSTNLIAHLPRPRDYAQRSEQSRPLTVHNRGTGSVELQLDGENIVTLRNNQTAEFHVLWHPDGTEHIIGNVPRRKMTHIRGDGGNIWQGGYFNYSESEFAMPVRLPAPTYVDADAFTVPTTDTLAQDEEFTAANLGRRRDTFTMRKAGQLIFYKNVRWAASAGGSMPAGSRTILHVVRNGVINPIPCATYGQFNNATPYELTWLAIAEVEEGDVIDPLLVYPQSSTMNIGVATVEQATQVVLLDQTIDYEWSE